MDNQQNDNLINLQKTSFWNFRHKKIYANKKEKFYDFIFGIIFEVIALIVIGFMVTKIRGISGDFLVEVEFLGSILLMGFWGRKLHRNYVCFGMLSVMLAVFIWFSVKLFLL